MSIRDLYLGVSGIEVKLIQQAFNTRRLQSEPALQEDGLFGPKTKAAIIGYQKRYGLTPDGIVGYQTRKQLFPNLAATFYLSIARVAVDTGAAGATSKLGLGGGKDTFIRTAGGLNAKDVAGGDVPDVDPLPLIPDLSLPRILGNGPMADFTVNNVTLPALSLPQSLFGLPKDAAQIQGGAQFQTKHLFQTQGNSPNPSAAGVLAFQQVYARNKDQDGHGELALGVQVIAPFIAKTSDGMKWGIQPYVQYTWADVFWHRGRFHLVSPFAQLTAQTDFHFGSPVIGIGVFPINMSFDVTDKISIIGQAGNVTTFDTSNNRIENGNQAALFGSWSF